MKSIIKGLLSNRHEISCAGAPAHHVGAVSSFGYDRVGTWRVGYVPRLQIRGRVFLREGGSGSRTGVASATGKITRNAIFLAMESNRCDVLRRRRPGVRTAAAPFDACIPRFMRCCSKDAVGRGYGRACETRSRPQTANSGNEIPWKGTHACSSCVPGTAQNCLLMQP